MTRRLPPLNALRAFEASARCGNFTRASRELFVTQGAISRHVATLEGWLKVQLFERDRAGLRLTPAGRRYYESVRVALDQIEHSTRQLQQDGDDWLLRVKLPPTFAVRWLIPRLPRFHERFPRVEVQFTTSHLAADLLRDDVDVSIHSDPDPPSGAGFQVLFNETLVPVCSPAMEDAPKTPGDLARAPRLCSLHRPQDWPAWLAAAGVPDVDSAHVLKFENAAMAYQAAAERLGVAIAVLPFVRQDLEAGRLVMPFEFPVVTQAGYFMAWRTDVPLAPRVSGFLDWIRAEAASEHAAP